MEESKRQDEISGREILERWGDPRLTLVNVLSQAAFERRRIGGSISLPVEQIRFRAQEVLPDLDREVAVYCGGPS